MYRIPAFITFLCATLLCIETSAQEKSDFTFQLLRQLPKAQTANTCTSPYSIRTILSLCAEGAEGITLQEMLHTLRLPKDPTQRRAEMAQQQKKFGEMKHLRINTTNTLWVEQSLRLLDSYQQIAQQSYAAEVQSLDFHRKPEQARQRINRFVEDKTNKLIKDLLPQGVIKSETQLVLTNTIYLKAEWEQDFDKRRTYTQDFFPVAAPSLKVAMMHQRSHFQAGVAEGHSIVALPYKGKEIVMWVLLPANKDLPGLIDKLDAALWTKLKKSAQMQKVELSLPKFEFESKYSLVKSLREMGMHAAFGDAAQFPHITAQSTLRISDVIHQAKIKVEEQGTEAAAATAVIMEPTSSRMDVQPEMPFVFQADRPFMFVIEHLATQEILFAGTVQKP